MASGGTQSGQAGRVIFLNRFFFPDHSATSQMLSDLAFALARAGHGVSIITSRQRYDAPGERLAPREAIDGVEVHRIWTTRFGRANLAGRALDYVTFYLSSTFALLRLARRGDVVVVKTDPPLLSIVAGPVARLKGARLVNWLQDIFPEVAVASGIGTKGMAGAGAALLAWLRDQTLRRAAANVVLGDRMADYVLARGVEPLRVVISPNWADGRAITPVARGDNALRREWGFGEAFVAGYSGNLGRVHEFATFLTAMEWLEREAGPQRVQWLFIGGGTGLQGLRQEVEQRGLRSVQFRPYQPRERLAQSLSAADVHLVSLRPEIEGFVVPSKYYGIAAAGRPAIFVGDGDGEIARILKRAGAGLTVAEGDGEGLAAAILALADDRARLRGSRSTPSSASSAPSSAGRRCWSGSGRRDGRLLRGRQSRASKGGLARAATGHNRGAALRIDPSGLGYA